MRPDKEEIKFHGVQDLDIGSWFVISSITISTSIVRTHLQNNREK